MKDKMHLQEMRPYKQYIDVHTVEYIDINLIHKQLDN